MMGCSSHHHAHARAAIVCIIIEKTIVAIIAIQSVFRMYQNTYVSP